MDVSSTNPEGTPKVARNWISNRRLVGAWDRGVKSVPVAMVYGAVVFGADNRKMYAHMNRIGALPPGTRILDLPSGGGVVLRGMQPQHRLRYTAADISPLMLERVRQEAARRGLEYVDTIETSADDLPFDDGSFDVVATYSGLHCVPDPERTIAEMFRVLRPGGEVYGSVVVRGVGGRQDRFIRLWQRRDILDVVVTEREFQQWLRDAGFEQVEHERTGCVLFFRWRRPEEGSGG